MVDVVGDVAGTEVREVRVLRAVQVSRPNAVEQLDDFGLGVWRGVDWV